MTAPLGPTWPHSIAAIDRMAIPALVIGLLAVAASRPAHADDGAARAQQRFDDGEALMKQGALDDACTAFAESNDLDPRAGTLIRLGQCREQHQQLASAWSAFHGALARAKDPRKRRFAEAAVAALAPRLSRLTIVVAADARVPGLTITLDGAPLDATRWNTPVPLDGGAHVVQADAPERRASSVVVSVPIERGDQTIRIAPLASSDAAPTSPAKDEPPTLDRHAAAPHRDHQPRSQQRTLALGVGGLGLATLALGGVLGAHAKGLERDAYERCSDPAAVCSDAAAANGLIDRARSRAVLANVGLGVGAAAIVGAAVLWFTGSTAARSDRAAFVPRVGPGLAAADLVVRF